VRLSAACASLCLALGVLATGAQGAAPLPGLEALMDYRPKIPLRVYTADKVLIGEFGQERRDFVAIADIPLQQKQALLAIEDARFYEHGGVDFKGVARALIADLSGGLRQGASTITMQVARNFFLSREKLFSRKLTEVMLAYKIEAALSKDQILEIYMNQIYLGQRAYGFGSAAQVYFGKPLKELNLAQAAMLAGLPQAPSTVNPVVNPRAARKRQELVLARMRALGFITDAQWRQALETDVQVRDDVPLVSTHAQYAAEMVRLAMVAQFKDEAYTRGIVVTTSLLKADQDAAYEALRHQVLAYDQRHGWRGPEDFVALSRNAAERQKQIAALLQKHPASDTLLPAVVLSSSAHAVHAVLANGQEIDLQAAGLRLAGAAFAPGAKPELRLQAGSLIRVQAEAKGRWTLTQMPNVGAALVALDNQTGAYRALVGGFDFNASQLNHVTQAWRQPGSAIKPFIYCAALDKGYSPATLVNDAPLLLGPEETGGAPWQPQNDDDVYDGAITLRSALARSKNVAAVRLLRAITPAYAHDYLQRFGFDPARHPVNYTLALGTGTVTPLQLAQAYSVFANGGFQIEPTLIQKVEDTRGTLLFAARTPTPAQESARVLDARDAFVMDSMLREVTATGTGAAASQQLGRHDLAGKTGTSSDAVDGWFAGYSGNVTAVAWMGYDEPQSLGNSEFGATLALPIWTDYMRSVLAGRPQNVVAVPDGVSRLQDDWVIDAHQALGAPAAIDLDLLDRIKSLFGP